jgi:hypothetical protein
MGQRDDAVIPGDAKHRSWNLEIPRCAIAHLRYGANAPSRNDGMWIAWSLAARNDERGTASGYISALLDQIVLKDRHLELKRAVVIFIVDKQHADEFFADIDLSRIVLFRPRHYTNFLIAEQALEIGVEFPDFLDVHGGLQYDLGFGKF